MMRVVDFKPEHAKSIELQPMQKDTLGVPSDEYCQKLLDLGPAVSGVDGDEVVFCGGLVKYSGHHVLWAMLSKNAGRCMIRVVRCAQRLLMLRDEKVYTLVRSDFEQGRRLVELLGFKVHPQGHFEDILPDGVAGDIYVRG